MRQAIGEPIGVRFDEALRTRVRATAEAAKDGEAAVVRAAVRLSLPLLEMGPQLVRSLQAGPSRELAGANGVIEAAKVQAAMIPGLSAVEVIEAAFRAGMLEIQKRSAEHGPEAAAYFIRATNAGLTAAGSEHAAQIAFQQNNALSRAAAASPPAPAPPKPARRLKK